MVNQLNITTPSFDEDFKLLLTKNRDTENDVTGVVKEILKNVRDSGNQAVFDYTEKFDHLSLNEDNMRVSEQEINQAIIDSEPETIDALKIAAKRINDFHIRHLPEDDNMTDAEGVELSVRWNAVSAAGIYVPGGKAVYPSSVLMNAIPAKAAGELN